MNCEESEKLSDLVRIAKKELEKFRLPPATEPLNYQTPSGNFISREWLEKRRRAEETFNKADEVYKSHISNCPSCLNRNKSRQRKT